MGKCGAFFSTSARWILYAVVLVSTAATLWGMVSSQVKNSKCWLGGDSTCLLFGSVSGNATRCGVPRLHLPTSGSGISCQYVIFYAAAQIFSMLSLCVLSIAVARGRKDGHNTESWRRCAKFGELAVVVTLALCSLAAALIMSIGFAVFCHEMKEHWRQEPSDLVYSNHTHVHHKAPSCSHTYLVKNVDVQFNMSGNGTYSSHYERVSFHHNYNVAQVACWASFLAWLVHLVISIIAFRRRPSVAESLPYALRPSESLNSLDDDDLLT
eukprot:scpid68818/ scgid7425/ 